MPGEEGEGKGDGGSGGRLASLGIRSINTAAAI